MKHFGALTKAAAMAALVAFLSPAFAGPPASFGGGDGRKADSGRSVRGGGGSSHQAPRLGSGRSNTSRGTSYTGNGGQGRGRSSGSATPILDALRESSGNRGYGNGSGLSELGRLADDYRWDKNRRDREDDYNKLQRDQMITSAVVNVVGIIAASQAQKYQAQAYAPAYAPAPCVAPAPVYVPQPAGHYETRRTEVQPGGYTTVQVWVAEFRDPHTGAIIDGHYETHRNWVPPVYQETQVWVTH